MEYAIVPLVFLVQNLQVKVRCDALYSVLQGFGKEGLVFFKSY